MEDEEGGRGEKLRRKGGVGWVKRMRMLKMGSDGLNMRIEEEEER